MLFDCSFNFSFTMIVSGYVASGLLVESGRALSASGQNNVDSKDQKPLHGKLLSVVANSSTWGYCLSSETFEEVRGAATATAVTRILGDGDGAAEQLRQPSLNKSGFTVGTQGTLTPRPSPGCQSGVRRQSSGVVRHPLEHVGYLAKPLDLVRLFCHRGRKANVPGMRTAQFALLVSH